MITDPSVDATVHQSFTEQRKMQSEWLRAQQCVERAKTLAWNSLPLLVRQNWLAVAEAEEQKHSGAGLIGQTIPDVAETKPRPACQNTKTCREACEDVDGLNYCLKCGLWEGAR